MNLENNDRLIDNESNHNYMQPCFIHLDISALYLTHGGQSNNHKVE